MTRPPWTVSAICGSDLVDWRITTISLGGVRREIFIAVRTNKKKLLRKERTLHSSRILIKQRDQAINIRLLTELRGTNWFSLHIPAHRPPAAPRLAIGDD